ncbi:MAG: ACT domain-containing protein [Anaerolineaceae bacterium]|nr:ACT domain-containing protein [Anaerolineaceae bacterium]
MTQSPVEALQQAILYTDNQDYVLVKLPPKAITAAAGVVAQVSEPFCGLLVDKDEVTLILPVDAWDDFKNRLPGHQTSAEYYRLLTFDIELPFDMVGFMAFVSQALAAAGVSILPLAAYSRDHILVAAAQLDTAMVTLRKLQQGN